MKPTITSLLFDKIMTVQAKHDFKIIFLSYDAKMVSNIYSCFIELFNLLRNIVKFSAKAEHLNLINLL